MKVFILLYFTIAFISIVASAIFCSVKARKSKTAAEVVAAALVTLVFASIVWPATIVAIVSIAANRSKKQTKGE